MAEAIICSFLFGTCAGVVLFLWIDHSMSSPRRTCVKKICKFYNLDYKKSIKKFKKLNFQIIEKKYNEIIDIEDSRQVKNTKEYLGTLEKIKKEIENVESN